MENMASSAVIPVESEVVAICDHLPNLKFSHTNPNAFTEHGAIVAASILNSPKAMEVSVLVVRTFVKLRQMLSTHTELRHKLTEFEARLDSHDNTIQALIDAIHQITLVLHRGQTKFKIRLGKATRATFSHIAECGTANQLFCFLFLS